MREVGLDPGADTGDHPFTLPVVRALARRGSMPLDPGVTFLVGENGTGKSTLVEALAVAAGFNTEGGSRNFRFATRASESSLGRALALTWSVHEPRTGSFLRAESYYNVASEIERLEREGGPSLLQSSARAAGRDDLPDRRGRRHHRGVIRRR